MFVDKQPELDLDTCYEQRHPACEHDTSDSWRSTDNKDFVLQTEQEAPLPRRAQRVRRA